MPPAGLAEVQGCRSQELVGGSFTRGREDDLRLRVIGPMGTNLDR
jgi:hypothetical protein